MLYKVSVAPHERISLDVTVTAASDQETVAWRGLWLSIRHFLLVHFVKDQNGVTFEQIEADIHRGRTCTFQIDAPESLMQLAEFKPAPSNKQ